MKYYSKDTLSNQTIDSIHDCYYNVTSKVPSLELTISIYNSLDTQLRADIEYWGASDTEVRDRIYSHIQSIKTI